MLRGSAKASTTDNEDACRDLSGRRLRVVNAEKKLQEWQAGEKARRAQIRAAKEEKERNKAEKRAEITQVRQLESGCCLGTEDAEYATHYIQCKILLQNICP